MVILTRHDYERCYGYHHHHHHHYHFD